MHDQAKPEGSLQLSLGDPHLHLNNSIYRNIRNRFLELGYRYTKEDFCHYSVLPYASLGLILEKRLVPYFDNVTVLREIEASHPRKFLVDELVQVKANYTLHESSHCIAHEVLKTISLEAKGLSRDEAQALRLLMTESFANSVEALANTLNETPELRFFHSVNSYSIHDKKAAVSFKHAIDLVGVRDAYRLLYVAYLFSNCLHAEINRTQFSELLSLTIKDEETRRKALDSPHVRKLVAYAFELSRDFRIQTTGFYLAYAGIKIDVRNLAKIDILSLLKNSAGLSEFLNRTLNLFVK